jgi:hypothetical protein
LLISNTNININILNIMSGSPIHDLFPDHPMQSCYSGTRDNIPHPAGPHPQFSEFRGNILEKEDIYLKTGQSKTEAMSRRSNARYKTFSDLNPELNANNVNQPVAEGDSGGVDMRQDPNAFNPTGMPTGPQPPNLPDIGSQGMPPHGMPEQMQYPPPLTHSQGMGGGPQTLENSTVPSVSDIGYSENYDHDQTYHDNFPQQPQHNDLSHLGEGYNVEHNAPSKSSSSKWYLIMGILLIILLFVAYVFMMGSGNGGSGPKNILEGMNHALSNTRRSFVLPDLTR